MQNEWRGFQRGSWEEEINVRDFIQKNYTPYDGDDSFLEGPTQDTTDLWNEVLELSKQEREAGGVLDMDTKIISTITSHGPGYLDKNKEKIVGFQTDKPFKRSLQPYGGIRMAVKACEDNGYHVDPEVVEYFTTHRKTHNAGVFDAYTPEMRACRSAHIITGLPDAYGRGRIIGDYRRPALYGVDRLIEDKEEQLATTRTIMYSDVIREREELSEQIRALKMLKELAKIYGCDISIFVFDKLFYRCLIDSRVSAKHSDRFFLTIICFEDTRPLRPWIVCRTLCRRLRHHFQLCH